MDAADLGVGIRDRKRWMVRHGVLQQQIGDRRGPCRPLGGAVPASAAQCGRIAMTGTAASIRVKRVYDPPAASDGTRVLVDRLWPRGLSKDRAAFDRWLKDAAPSAELREWFGHDPARYAEFARRYRAELAASEEAVGQIRALMRHGPVTLLYSARDEEHNQALVLAAYLRDLAKHDHEAASA
jgi:uncharacterized protein YeaO (DUF488 family)